MGYAVYGRDFVDGFFGSISGLLKLIGVVAAGVGVGALMGWAVGRSSRGGGQGGRWSWTGAIVGFLMLVLLAPLLFRG
ncbi:MAG: hypothetical protein GY720_09455 [bacterium]|nr:hypothetical protein [bacterium]